MYVYIYRYMYSTYSYLYIDRMLVSYIWMKCSDSASKVQAFPAPCDEKIRTDSSKPHRSTSKYPIPYPLINLELCFWKN